MRTPRHRIPGHHVRHEIYEVVVEAKKSSLVRGPSSIFQVPHRPSTPTVTPPRPTVLSTKLNEWRLRVRRRLLPWRWRPRRRKVRQQRQLLQRRQQQLVGRQGRCLLPRGEASKGGGSWGWGGKGGGSWGRVACCFLKAVRRLAHYYGNLATKAGHLAY